jgi:3-oxoacyl-[acyl-carrier protein] reductase
MDLGLKGRVALVCGASKGIGFATAELLAREGAQLAICSRDAASIEKAAARLAPTGAEVLAIAADLSTMDGVATVVRQTLERYGRVDVLITNTGGPPTGMAIAHEWSAWEKASELLLRSAVELTRAFIPGMRERKWGRVVGITSFAVKRPVPSLVLSNAMRADEVAIDGVTVNTVLPGYTETERLDALAAATVARTGVTRDSVFDGWKAETPLGRLGKPEELAAVIGFLASEPAGFVTGQAICVDGGAIRALI